MDEQFLNTSENNEENQENVKNINTSVSVPEEISIYDVFSKFHRQVILFWISVTVILLPFSDTIYLPAIHTIAIDLKTTDTLVSLTVSMYLLFVGISSLIWGVISDRWGRNITMRIGLFLFLVSSILCIFASNIYILLLLRILQGCSVSVTIVVGQGIIADIYSPDERGWVIGIFFIPVLLGVVMGPTIGGILTYYYGWRSTFAFQSIFSVFVLLIYTLFMPETHQYIVMRNNVDKKLIERNEISEPKLTNPLLPLKYLTNLSTIPYILSASTAFASIIINQCLLAITLAQQPYNFNELNIGFSNIPLSVGEVFGCLIGGYLSDKGNQIFRTKTPENRLLAGTICFMLIPIGLIIYGWAFQFNLNVSIPIISAAVVAFGQSVYRPAVYSYLTVTEQQNAATVSSANNSLNFIFAAIGLSVSVPIMNSIDIGPYFTILAFMNIVAIIPAGILMTKKMLLMRKNYEQL